MINFGFNDGPEDFDNHVDNLRGTMFYVCQGSCLCGTVNNRGKVIYCYGDLVPRHSELFSDGQTNSNGRTSPRDLLAAQLGIWVFGLLALLIVLLLIRKSITSLRKHIERVTERLPVYHDDEDILTPPQSPSLHQKDTTLESMEGMLAHSDMDGTLTPDTDRPDSPPILNLRGATSGATGKSGQVGGLKTLRMGRKDYKKGGDALRGKNVTEAFRVKEKDLKRTGK